MNKIFIVGALALAATTSTVALPAMADSRHERREDRQENASDRIERAFRNDPLLRRFKLGADTVGRRIELEGRVNTRRERERAIRLAQDVAPRQFIDAHRLDVR